MDEIVERIIARMKAVGLNQKTLAQKIGVRQPTITEWKTDVTSSYTKYLPKLAEVLDTSVGYLLTGEQNDIAPSTEAGQVEKLANALSEQGIVVEKLTENDILRIAQIASVALQK